METFNLDVLPGKSNPVCHASQYDEGRAFRINLYEGSQPYTLDGSEVITVSVRKPDGNIVIGDVENTSADYVEVVTTEQMTACHGDNICEVRITKGSQDIGSLNFILAVEKDPTAGGVESETVIYNLQTQVATMVSDEVAEQYDSNAVMFDETPTAGHGNGYAVTSQGIKTQLDAVDAALASKANSADLADVATSGNYNDLSNRPNLAEVATSGDYDDLNNKPAIPTVPQMIEETLTSYSGRTTSYGTGSRITRTGNHVVLQFSEVTVVSLTSAQTSFLIIPDDCRPAKQITFCGFENGTARSFNVSQAGNVNKSGNTAAVGVVLEGSVSYDI